MTSIIFDNDALYGRGERQALEWVGQRAKWVSVRVTRRSDKPFDMNVVGKHKKYNDSEMDFSGFFLLCALREFWAANLISAPLGDWSFIRDRDDATNWRVFENVYAQQALKQTMVPMFSQAFLSAVWATWEQIYPDAGRCTNAEAVELCLDADRLSSHAGEWADKEFDAAQEEHGYEKAMRELCRLVKLV